jgi:hypothetical protein
VLAKENKHITLEKRDKALDNNISDNLLTNLGFISYNLRYFPIKVVGGIFPVITLLSTCAMR